MSASVTLRPFEPGDRGFVIKAFLTSYGKSTFAADVPGPVLVDLLEPLLISWTTTVAVAPDGELLGWICADGERLAWVFVKPDFRQRRLATALLDHANLKPLTGGAMQVTMPFMPTRAPNGRSFKDWAASKGYAVFFRPYLPLCEVHKVVGGAA